MPGKEFYIQTEVTKVLNGIPKENWIEQEKVLSTQDRVDSFARRFLDNYFDRLPIEDTEGSPKEFLSDFERWQLTWVRAYRYKGSEDSILDMEALSGMTVLDLGNSINRDIAGFKELVEDKNISEDEREEYVHLWYKAENRLRLVGDAWNIQRVNLTSDVKNL